MNGFQIEACIKRISDSQSGVSGLEESLEAVIDPVSLADTWGQWHRAGRRR